MDRMSEYETFDYVDNIEYLDVNDWERTRLEVYTIAQIMSKKKLKPSDILHFSWDPEEHSVQSEPLPQEISNEDIARLKAKAQQRNQNLKSKLEIIK